MSIQYKSPNHFYDLPKEIQSKILMMRPTNPVAEMVMEHFAGPDGDGVVYNHYICRVCGAEGTDDPDCSACGNKMCVMLQQW